MVNKNVHHPSLLLRLKARRTDEVAAYSAHQKRIDEACGSPGPVREAFCKLCDDGCDPSWLKILLYETWSHPFERSKRSFTSADCRKLESIVRQLEPLSNDLKRLASELSLPTVGPQLFQLAAQLASVARSVNDIISTHKSEHLVTLTATQWLPIVVGRVVDQTGKPHFSELATLLGAAYERPEFAEDELKMRFHREKKKKAQWRAQMREAKMSRKDQGPV